MTWQKNAGRAAIEILINVAAPFVVYSLTRTRLGDVGALLASSAPPIAWSVVEVVRKRRVDAFSLLVIAGIAFSLLAFAGGGSVKFLQLRENLVSALIGAVFLVSAAIGRPLIYELARAGRRRQSAEAAARFEQLNQYAGFRRTMTFMTLVWGCGLLAQTALACALVFALPIATYLIVGPIVSYACLGALALWTWWYARERQRAGAALRRAEGVVEP